ncbi:MAG: hypothetical protein V1706_10680 [Pseudomonadota bacterium]
MDLGTIISWIAELDAIQHVINFIKGNKIARRIFYSAILAARRETFFYIREYLNQGKFDISVEKKIAELWDTASVEALELSSVACDLCRRLSDMFQVGSNTAGDIKDAIDQVLVDFDKGRAKFVVDVINDKVYLVDNDFFLLRSDTDTVDKIGAKIKVPDKTISLSVGMPDIKALLQVNAVDFFTNQHDYKTLLSESVKAIDRLSIVESGKDVDMSANVRKNYAVRQTPTGIGKK